MSEANMTAWACDILSRLFLLEEYGFAMVLPSFLRRLVVSIISDFRFALKCLIEYHQMVLSTSGFSLLFLPALMQHTLHWT